MSEKIPKEHYLFEALREDPNVYVDDEKNYVKIGDTIEYIANNQLGKRKYNVIESLDENGNVEKSLEEVDFTPSKKMTMLNDFTQTESPKESNDEPEPSIFKFHWYPDDGSKGGKKKHKKTQHKRRRKWSKSKSKSRMTKSKKYRRTRK